MKDFKGKTAVITGAGSGLGLEVARSAAKRGMNLVLCDVQADTLAAAEQELSEAGVELLTQKLDVASAEQVEALGRAVFERFGAPHFVFNNAGVGAGGMIWEHSLKDWEWVIGVNLMGVAHGIRVFVPIMLEAAKADPSWEGQVVNTASMAGLLNAPNMGVYNVTKHAVVSLSETLYQDLSLVTDQVKASVLCPYFVPTGIHQSHRNRPKDALNAQRPTRSQMVAQAMSTKAVTGGKVSASDVAEKVFAALAAGDFYIFSHPEVLSGVRTRMEDILQAKNPSDPFADRPKLREQLKGALADADAG